MSNEGFNLFYLRRKEIPRTHFVLSEENRNAEVSGSNPRACVTACVTEKSPYVSNQQRK